MGKNMGSFHTYTFLLVSFVDLWARVIVLEECSLLGFWLHEIQAGDTGEKKINSLLVEWYFTSLICLLFAFLAKSCSVYPVLSLWLHLVEETGWSVLTTSYQD